MAPVCALVTVVFPQGLVARGWLPLPSGEPQRLQVGFRALGEGGEGPVDTPTTRQDAAWQPVTPGGMQRPSASRMAPHLSHPHL